MTGERRADRIPHRNRSPHGWWIASYLERLEWADEDRRNLNRRCLAWENAILVQAPSRSAAHHKAIRFGRLSDGSEVTSADGRRKGVWRFEGLTSLLPVYERLEDGAEVFWREYRGRTVRTIKAMVVAREALEAFDDRNVRSTKRTSGRTRG